MSSNNAGFHFHIRPSGDGWSWQAIDADGQVRDAGAAPTKAVAAACVIRMIARSLHPDQDVPRPRASDNPNEKIPDAGRRGLRDRARFS